MLLQRMKTYSHPDCDGRTPEWSNSKDYSTAWIDRFGNGSEKTNLFRIVLTLDDIETVISGMAATGNAKARRIQRALALAEAVENLIDRSDFETADED